MSSNSVKLLQVAAQLLAVSVVAACTNNGVDQTSLVNTTAAAHYSIGGTVSGLTSSGLVLQSNTGEKLKIAHDGAFQFTTTLTSGSSYYVLVSVQPQAPSQTCSVSNGTGAISSANISNVQISCQNKTSQTDSIGGMVVGATGSGLILQNNGADNLAISSNGSFTFPTQLPGNTPYSVSVLSPPINPYQNCSVSNSPGMTAGSDVSNIVVSCTVNSNPTHTIGGTVSGLAQGTTLVLQDNGRDNLSVKSNGSFTFPMQIPSGAAYSVSVQSASSGSQSQTCLVKNASAVVGTSNVTGVAVQCTSNLLLSVSVSGLSGSGLVLQNTDNGDSLPVASNGTAMFAAALAPGDAYNVTVTSQPTNPSQACAVTNSTGTAGVAPGPTVSCATNSYTVSGVVMGLPTNLAAGQQLTLLDNQTDAYSTLLNGPFTFATPVPSGSAYSVTVSHQPGADTSGGKPGIVQTSVVCQISAGSGVVTSGNINGVVVNCVQPYGYAYVTNAIEGSVSAYLIDSTTGTLVPSGSPVAAGTKPISSAAYTFLNATGSPVTGNFLYVANNGSSDLSVYSADPNTGALKPASTTPANTASLGGLIAPTSIVLDYAQSGVPPFLYITNSGQSPGVSALSLDKSGTTLSTVSGSPFETTGTFSSAFEYFDFQDNYLAIGPTSNAVSVFSVSDTSGTLTLQQSFPVEGVQFTSIALTGLTAFVYAAGSGQIWAYQFYKDILFQPFNAASLPDVTYLTGCGGFSAAGAAVFYLYATSPLGIWGYTVGGKGTLQLVTNAPFTGGAGSGPMLWGQMQCYGTQLYVLNASDNTIYEFSIDTNTGELSLIGTVATGQGPSSITVTSRASYTQG